MQIDRTQTISKHGIGAADRENLGWFQKYWISGVPGMYGSRSGGLRKRTGEE